MKLLKMQNLEEIRMIGCTVPTLFFYEELHQLNCPNLIDLKIGNFLLYTVSTLILDSHCQLIKKGNWMNLKQLTLNKIQSHEGINHIAQGKWPKLSKIDLDRNELTEKGFHYLCSANWPSIAHLELADNHLTFTSKIDLDQKA